MGKRDTTVSSGFPLTDVDILLTPTAFVATTVQLYSWSLVRPRMIMGELSPDALISPQVTV